MSDQSIGTIAASVVLKLDQLQASVSEAKATISQLGADMKTQLDKAGQETAAALRNQAASVAKEIGGMMQRAGLEMVGALGMAVKVGADFESKLIEVANNTTMSTQEIASMTESVKTLGRESGASMTQLAEGAMHISNFGFSAAQSTTLLNAAMKSAVSTGSDVGKVAEILANVMHEFSIKTEDAGKAMNLLHLAAATGNMTLEQLTEAGGPAFAMAANLGVSLNETAAAMSALTKHGFTAAEAATQVRNILSHIAEPAAKTREMIEALSKSTGVDLVKDFSIAGLQGKGLAGVLDDIKTAAAKAGVDTSDLMMKLIPAMRGGIGAMALAGTAASDFREELLLLADAMSGKVDPTTEAFNRQQETLTAQLSKARNELVLMADDIQKALLPALLPLIANVREAAQWFEALPDGVKKGIAEFVLFGGAALVLVGTLAKLIATFATMSAALPALGEALAAMGVLMTGPYGWAIAATIAAIGGLIYAYNRLSDSGAKSTDELVKDSEAQGAAATKARENAEEVSRLIGEYNKLALLLKPTSDQLTRMHDILNRISELSPDLVSGFDKEGNAIGLVAAAANRAAQAFGHMADEETRAASLHLAAENVKRAESRDTLNQELAKQLYLQSNKLKVGSGIAHYGDADAQKGGNPFIGVSPPSPFHVFGEGKPYYYGPQLDPANSAEQGATNANVHELTRQIGELDRQTQVAKNSMTELFKGKMGPPLPDGFKAGGGGKPNRSANDYLDSLPDEDKKKRGAASALDDLKQKAEAAREALQKVKDELFALTHDQYATDRYQSQQQYGENIAAGVPKADALALLTAQNAKTAREEKESWDERAKKQEAGIKTMLTGLQSFFASQEELQNEEVARMSKIVGEEYDKQTAIIVGAQKALRKEYEAIPEALKQEAEEEARMHKVMWEANAEDLLTYQTYLMKKLQETKLYSEEWKKLNEELLHLMQEGDRKSGPITRQSTGTPKYQGDFKKALLSMREQLQSILGDAFTKLFEGDTKNLFKDMLKSFEEMLAQMAAKALVAGIANMIFGGIPGGFLGGILSVFGFGGGGGSKAASASGGGIGGTRAASVVNVNFHGPVSMKSDADIRSIGEAIAFHAQQRLSVQVGR